jgi:hypothetical protein
MIKSKDKRPIKLVAALIPARVPEKVLCIAARLENSSKTPFSAESLVIAAWKAYPLVFGLNGHEGESADSNKVLCTLMGRRGLVQRGLLIRVGPRTYSLTDRGRRWATGEIVSAEKPAATVLPPVLDKRTQQMVASKAFAAWQDGQKKLLNFMDACLFWDIPAAFPRTIDECVAAVQTDLEQLRQVLDGQDTRLCNGHFLHYQDVKDLMCLNKYLHEHFREHLTRLKNRLEGGT